MADRLAFLFDMECDRLDSHAKAFWNNKRRKQLRLKIAEVEDLLHQDKQRYGFDDKNSSLSSRCADLEDIVYAVDQLIDDWEQSEKSKSKIEQEVERIHGRLVRVLESFHKLIAGDDVESTAISEESFPRIDDYIDLKIFKIVNSLLLLNDEKMLRFIPIMGMDGIEKSNLLAQSIYNDEKVKTHFQSRAWVFVGENLDISKIAEEIAVELGKTDSTENVLEPREVLKENRFLLVLSDVWDKDDERLEKLKSWLNMWLKVEGSCVLLTTRFRRVADLLGTVPVQQLPSSSDEDPLLHSMSELASSVDVHSPFLGHDKGLEPLATESVVVASTSGSKDDETASAISGHFEPQSETVPAADTTSLSAGDRVPASNSEIVAEDEMTCPPQIDILPSYESEIKLKSLGRAGLSAHAPETLQTTFDPKERMLLNPDVEFEGQMMPSRNLIVKQSVEPAADTTSRSAGGRVPASSLSNVVIDSSMAIMEENQMTCPPQIDTLTHEHEIQLISVERGGSSMDAPGSLQTTFDAKERMLPIGDMSSETVPAQYEGEGQMKPGSNISVEQSVKPAESIAVESVRSSPFPKIPVEDQFLKESGLYIKESIKRTLGKIFSHIKNVRATKIAVHGIGGIGKTTVLNALKNHPKTKCIFCNTILVTVSRYWSVRKIQDDILRELSLGLEYSETDSQVAERLLKVLRGRKFLLLLDDVWEQIDLEAVGIPNPTLENGCKIIMASRKLDTCHAMNVFKVIKVKTVSRKEARELFYEQVGRIIQSSDIQSFAETIVKSCSGLPLLIIVTGRALAEENNVSMWKDASRKFSLPRIARGCQNEDVIQRLKFSFDQLKENDVKSCFLHCALFPEDQELDIYRFIEYCIQEGLITGAQADARKRGHDIVDVLVHASLLQVTEGGDYIKMHDLIRDLALGILSSVPTDSQFWLRAESSQLLLRAYSRSTEPVNAVRSSSSTPLNTPESSRLSILEGNQLLLRAGAGLTEPPLQEEWKKFKMMFLMDNELCTLPEKPNSPELLTLFLQRNCWLRVIPPSFFACMTSLKVLNLSKTRIKSLPETVFKLKNLLILILRDCERLFMLPPEIGSLVCLEVLDLQGTKINKLPDEIGELASLRHLEVSFYGSIDDSEYVKLPRRLISKDMISRLCKLETLSIVLYPGDERWYEDVKYVKTEVSKLTKLSSLCFHFPEVEHVQEFLEESTPWKDKLLTEFKFVVGHDVKGINSQVPGYVEFDYNQQGQCLRFVNGEKKPDEVLQILARSTAFYLDNHLDIDSLSNFGVNNINRLKFCIISECPEFETVVHIEEHSTAVFPHLETLSIHLLWNLTCIWKGIVPEGSFAELRILSLYACPKLEYVFRSSLIQSVCKLEELVIDDCPAIKQIIVEDETIDSGSVTLPSLKKLTLHYLPGLVSIWRGAWPLLELISFYSCPNLKKIGIDSRFKDTIIEIQAEKSWWDALEWEDAEFRLHLENRSTTVFRDRL